NPSRISSHDMMGGRGSITHSAVNSNGDKNAGFYSLEADVAGTYVFDLMRWPPEAMGPINGKPKWLLGKGNPKLISVNEAGLKIDGMEYTKAIGEKDEFVSFEMKLGKGPFKLENMFYDGDKPVVGASYIRVIRR
ncbi:MAG: hypothetical protein KAR47_21660, partial [Planctomycetes bacterium]|nr:hypothetical protein [Planctomycetota bacterium]